MHHDRGGIKWTSLMLPEHVEMLRAFSREEKIISKPKLDIQEIEHQQNLIQTALYYQQAIALQIYEEDRHIYLTAIPIRADVSQQKLHVKVENEETKTILFSDIFRIDPL